jgi:hypothetical protein
MGLLIPHLIWHVVTMFTNGGDYMNYFYLLTYWSWCNAIISQVLSLLAANNPEYWHVMSFAWLEVAHSLNLTVTFCFWTVLGPMIAAWVISAPDPFAPEVLFGMFHMTVLHATPLLMTWLNIYYTDIKLLSADWPMMAFHGFLYLFANWLGMFDKEMHYPIIDWVNTPLTILIIILGIGLFNCGFYLCWCSYADKHYKRRGEI